MSAQGRPTPRQPVAGAGVRGPPPPPKPGRDDKDVVPIQIRAMNDAEDGGRRAIHDFANNKVGDDYPWLKKFLLEKGGLIWRVVKVAAILLPLIPSIMLLVFIARDRNFGGSLNTWYHEDPTNVQVVVSIIVSSITYLNVLTISNLFRAVGIDIKDNFVFKWLLSNVGLAEKSDSGDRDSDNGPADEDVKKWSKFLFGGKWTFKEFFIGIASFALLYAPHVIWMGSLTPNPAGKFLDQSKAALVPDYTASTEFNWANNERAGNRSTCFLNFTAPARKPGIGGCAGSGAQETIYTSMTLGATIMRLDDSIEHASPTDANYSYAGRSFGLGSAAGIVVPFNPSEGVPIARNYTERGLFTNVECKRNASSAFKLTTISNSSMSLGMSRSPITIPTIYKTDGKFPDGTNVTAYSIVGDGEGNAVGWSTDVSDQGFLLMIAVGGSYYNRFNHIQCDIKFVPTNFDVYNGYNTNYSSPTIVVANLSQAGDFDRAGQDGKLASTAVKQLEIVSRFQSSPYVSELGYALDTNLQAWAAGLGLADDFDQDDPMIFDSVADAVTVAIDDILVYVGRAQLSLGASKNVDYLPWVQRVQIGTKPYIYTAMLLTGLLFVLGSVRLAYTFIKTRRQARGAESVQGKAEYSKLYGPTARI